ncbi:MAG TPA: glycosyltransferase family 9 protein [Chloroflexia bacterium]|nr:glycosyltransferase family 9 protein [Chloroflexia bacterium]
MLNHAKMLARQALIRTMYGPKWLGGANSRKDRPGPMQIKRVLVVRPDHLGDLLFATPALDRLRRAFPDLYITGLTGPWGRAMWEHNRNLDSIATLPFPGIVASKSSHPLTPYRMLERSAATLKPSEYDLAVVLRFDHWWGAVLMWLAGIPYRWGYDTPGMGAWLTNKAHYVSGRHEVEQNLWLVEEVINFMYGRARVRRVGELEIDRERGIPALQPPRPVPPECELPADWLDAPKRAVIHPGTAAANKLWTISGWSEIINRLIAEGWAVALTGSPDERRLADAISSAAEAQHGTEGLKLTNIAGQTANIAQLAWVLDKAHIVLGVDSGPLHIAAALHKLTLHLYGPSDEAIWGPWGDPRKHRAFRAPGTRPTMHLEVGSPALEGGPEMRAITPEMVWVEIGELGVKRET